MVFRALSMQLKLLNFVQKDEDFTATCRQLKRPILLLNNNYGNLIACYSTIQARQIRIFEF